jgi:hypothetical protein
MLAYNGYVGAEATLPQPSYLSFKEAATLPCLL